MEASSGCELSYPSTLAALPQQKNPLLQGERVLFFISVSYFRASSLFTSALFGKA
jgi:hypothetical protein